MTIKIAQPAYFQAICDFYEKVCQQQQYDEYSPKWTWQDYPSEQGLNDAMQHHQIMINIKGEQVIAAGVLSKGEDSTYQDVPWQHKLADDQITVLHLFAVDKDYRGHGIAQTTLRAILNQVRENGQEVVHLDIIDPNLPAEKAYLKAGFHFNNSQIINYADLGPTPAKLFERLV